MTRPIRAATRVDGPLAARRKLARTARTDGRGNASDEQVRAHRRRQASVAALLDQTFGQWAECNPDLWERRAYLMLVGLVYERLATNEKELPTEELVTLAKILAENRRADSRVRDNHRAQKTDGASSPGTGELPDRFGDIVRQVYGTNLQGAAGR